MTIEASVSWPAKLSDGCLLKLFLVGPVLRVERGKVVMKVQRHEFRTSGKASVAGQPELQKVIKPFLAGRSVLRVA